MEFSEAYETPVLVGEGGEGKVYRLKDKKSGEYLALKVTENEKIWEQEVAILKEADHDLFPAFYDAGKEDGKYYILMEYIWGEKLLDVILRRRGFAQPEVMRMALMVADGLGWLQTKERPVIFRDLKADNIIISPDGSIRLVDFGSACFLKDDDNSIVGTVGASAPEQFEGKSDLSSDVYAFGRLFHLLLTGDNSYAAKPDSVLLPITSYDPNLSSCLELLIEDCTGVCPQDRLPDMYCVTKRIVEIASQSPRGYRKMEKQAAKTISERKKNGLLIGSAEISYEKNIRN